MAASVKNILIGIFVLLALAIIVFLLLFLHPSVGDNAKTLRVRFTNIDKVNVGSRVTFAGKPVGEVVSIEEIPDARIGRINHQGDVYIYQLTLKVDSSVSVYNSDEISIRTSGLLGEKNIEIDPQPLKSGGTLIDVENQILYASPSGSVEETLKQFDQISTQLKVVLEDFHDTFTILKNEKVIEGIAQTIKNMGEITQVVNQPEKLSRMLTNFVNLSERTHQSWKTLDAACQNFYQLSEKANISWVSVENTLKEFNLASVNLQKMTNQTQLLVANMAQGKGTLGKLFVADDLYLRVKSILNKGENIFSDIKQYGILFQHNKRWQRLQAQRMKLLHKLSDSNKFANYFNDEINQISSSLSSISMVLNEVECYPYSLLNTPEFTCRFADLIKRVGEMENALKMYNEQVIDQE
ncbi:MlaD family protein [Candidatus Protochlamydia amoebophila]|nr:MlaD family protein [Candidatus Protochlamydia amoebophila]